MPTTTPLHPALVHFSIGWAVLVAILAPVVFLLIFKKKTSSNAWILVFIVQALVFGAGLVGQETGEDEEHAVEKVLDKNLIHEHEERAEAFLIAAGITAALSLLACAAAFKNKTKLATPLQGLSLVGSVVTAALVLYTGKAGGEMVYIHDAPKAYQNNLKQAE